MADEQEKEQAPPPRDEEQASEKGGRKDDARSQNGEDKGKGEGKEAPKKKFRLSPRTLIIGGLVLIVVIVAGVLYWLHARNFESTDDAYTTAHVHEISARVSGTVLAVNVDDNQPVQAGQALVVLDPRDYQVAVERARAQRTQAQAQLAQRRAAADEVKANLDRAQSDYNRAIGLFQRDARAVSKADVDNATAALKNAQGQAAAAGADVAAAEAAVATSDTALSDAQLQLSYTTVLAPVDGVVGKKTVETGARIQPGQALMAVVERDSWVLGNFKETQLAHVRIGMHVDVEIDAVPGHSFGAHVDSFQPGTGSAFALLPPDNATGNFTKIVQRVPVKIVFDDLGPYRDRVTPGLSCIPKIDLRTGPPPPPPPPPPQ